MCKLEISNMNVQRHIYKNIIFTTQVEIIFEEILLPATGTKQVSTGSPRVQRNHT